MIDSSTISDKTLTMLGNTKKLKACGYKTLEEIEAHEDSHYNLELERII